MSQVQVKPVCLNGRVFDYKLSGCGFESRYSHLRKVFLKFLTISYCIISRNILYTKTFCNFVLHHGDSIQYRCFAKKPLILEYCSFKFVKNVLSQDFLH